MPKSLVLPMPYFNLLRSISSRGIIVGLLLVTSVAEAQMSPGGMGPGMGGPAQPAGEEKKEGVAEAAPKTPGLLPTTPALPAPKGRRKRYKLLEFNGYYRLRTDWFKNFNLGFIGNTQTGTSLGGAPFARALGCSSTAIGHPCDDSLSSANMRLRLEPVFNLDEGTSVHVQADVLDNLVLGSTPIDQFNGYTAANPPPLGAFSTGQVAPVAGANSDRNSIVVKRAWAEVALPLGVLKFGRQPNSWGMGIYYNSGGWDPINGIYDLDGDNGSTVDRVSFSAIIPGTDLRAMVAADWDMTRLVSNQTSANKGNTLYPYDLDDSDDTNGWVGAISKIDSPQEFRDTVERGDVAFNYGAYFEYKTQAWDNNLTNFVLGSTFDSTINYVPRHMKTYSPDLWAKLGYGGWTLEAEFIAQLGSIQELTDYGKTTSADIRKFGGTGRATWRGLDGKLRIGLESGAASGDQWDNTPQGNTNIAFANLLGVCPTGQVCPADTRLTQFIFNPDYKIDLILFRHLIGAVTNAAYVKPFLTYDLTKNISFKIANVTSFALKPVATPGNGTMYGTEFDTDLGYTNGTLFVGISYGVLFPLGAMNHPDDTNAVDAGGTFGYGVDPVTGETNVGIAGTAHTIQTRMILRF
jgi:uncharacterized protein (TIGR04551 family)